MRLLRFLQKMLIVILFLSGLSFIAYAAFLFASIIGFLVSGIIMILISFILEKNL